MKEEGESLPSYCETHDCSEFPAGYYSINIGGTWFYVPTEETLKSVLDVESGPTIEVEGKGISEYSGSSAANEIDGVAKVAIVIPDGNLIKVMPCCETIAKFYKLQMVENLRSHRIVLGGRHTFWQLNWPPQSVLENELDVPVELEDAFREVSQKYYIRVRLTGDKHIPVQMHAWSKQPVIAGERIELRCSDHLCDLKWTGKAGAIQGQFVNLQFGACVVSDGDCWTREAVDSRFERIERYMADIEALIDAIKVRPE